MKNMVAIISSVLIFALPATSNAAIFETRFMTVCKADGGDKAECSCRFKKAKKPNTKGQENLMIAVIQRDDAKVDKLIAENAELRSISLINSLTGGLMACSFN